MKDETEKLVDKKIEQIANILKCKETDIFIGEILSQALNKVNSEKGMIAHYLKEIDKHGRRISFLKRIEFFDKLFDLLRKNDNTKHNVDISEHDSAWIYDYFRGKDKARKVIAISNSRGPASHIFIKEEYFIGDEDYSKYYIVKAYDSPDRFFREDCGRQSIRTLVKKGRLRFFEENYANGSTRFSFDDYENIKHDPNHKDIYYDYERCVLRYDCQGSMFMTYEYFNPVSRCEYALGQLESAYWMRTE